MNWKMKYSFHLRNHAEEILDDAGIEVRSREQAYAQAVKAVRELIDEGTPLPSWKGWRLDAADAAGTVMFSIDLAGDLAGQRH